MGKTNQKSRLLDLSKDFIKKEAELSRIHRQLISSGTTTFFTDLNKEKTMATDIRNNELHRKEDRTVEKMG